MPLTMDISIIIITHTKTKQEERRSPKSRDKKILECTLTKLLNRKISPTMMISWQLSFSKIRILAIKNSRLNLNIATPSLASKTLKTSLSL